MVVICCTFHTHTGGVSPPRKKKRTAGNDLLFQYCLSIIQANPSCIVSLPSKQKKKADGKSDDVKTTAKKRKRAPAKSRSTAKRANQGRGNAAAAALAAARDEEVRNIDSALMDQVEYQLFDTGLGMNPIIFRDTSDDTPAEVCVYMRARVWVV